MLSWPPTDWEKVEASKLKLFEVGLNDSMEPNAEGEAFVKNKQWLLASQDDGIRREFFGDEGPGRIDEVSKPRSGVRLLKCNCSWPSR